VFFFIVFTAISRADVKVDDLYADYTGFFNGGRDPLLPQGNAPNKALSLHLETSFLSAGYFRSNIHSLTDTSPDGGSQFRAVGLELGLGARVTDTFEFGYYHHSQHLLDIGFAQGTSYPLEDGLQIRVHFITNTNKKVSIF